MVQDTKHCEINILELMEPMIALKELAELDIAVPQPAETMVVINDYINSVDAIPKFLKDSVRTNDEYVEPAIASKSEIVVAILDGSVDTIEKSVKFIAEETAITENVPIFLKLTVEGSMDTANDIVKPVIVLKEDASIESSLETVENPVSKPDTVGESVNPMNVIQEIVTMENATESVGTSTCEGTMNIVDVMKPAEIAKPIAVVKEYVKTNEVGETVKPLLVLRETVETKNAAVDCSKSNDNIYNVEGIDTNLQEAMDTVVESMEHMAVQTLIEQTCIEYMKEVSKIVANTFNKLFTWAYFLGLFVLVASIAKKSLVGAPSIIQNPQTKLNPGIFNAEMPSISYDIVASNPTVVMNYLVEYLEKNGMSMTESQKSSLIVVQRLFSEVNNQEEPSTKTAINSSSRDSSKDIPTNPPSTSQSAAGKQTEDDFASGDFPRVTYSPRAVTLRLRSVVMTLRNYIRQHKQEPLWERVDSFLSYFFPSWK